MSRPTLEIDHLRYLGERRYRRVVHAAMRRRGARPGLGMMAVVHESDDSCCQWEDWPVTFERLLRALNDDGLPTLGVQQ